MNAIKAAAALILPWFFAMFASPAFADPPRADHHHWRNVHDAGHYVLYDHASRQWVETIDCRIAFRFNLVANGTNELTLHDPSRDMTVLLNYDGMYLKAHGESQFSFYQAGAFDTRVQFSHYDRGTYTGAITKQHACTFVEYLAWSSSPNYSFTLANNFNGAVEMYDGSRDLWVKLDDARMDLRFGSQPYEFFRDGRW